MEILGGMFLTILITIFEGFTFSTLWGWFIANTFHIATISIAQGLGIAMTIRYLTNQTNVKKEKEMTFMQSVVTSAITCLATLAFGAIILMFI